jgi:hypothetical protein
MNCSDTRRNQSRAALGCHATADHHTDESGSEGITMRHVSTVLAVVLTIATAHQLFAQTPPEIDPAAWAKVSGPTGIPGRASDTEPSGIRAIPRWRSCCRCRTGPERVRSSGRPSPSTATPWWSAQSTTIRAPSGCCLYVFDRDEGGADTWGQIAKLTASDGASSTASAGRFRSAATPLSLGPTRTTTTGRSRVRPTSSVGIRGALTPGDRLRN